MRSLLSAGIPPIPLLYICQLVKLITGLSSRALPPFFSPLVPLFSRPVHGRPSLAYPGADRIFELFQRTQRVPSSGARSTRNFANPNKTEAAVSATRVRGPPRNAKNVPARAPPAKSIRPISFPARLYAGPAIVDAQALPSLGPGAPSRNRYQARSVKFSTHQRRRYL